MDSELASFFAKGRQKQYSAGELMTSGEAPSAVFYIRSGFVKVYSISDTGDRYVHLLYKQGEIFPLIWALKGTTRRVFYEATSPVSAWSVSKTTFLDFLKTHKGGAYAVLEQITEQFRIYADRLDNLQYKSAHERVVYRLLFLAARFGSPQGGGYIINAPITHELISESVNLTRETVSREIEKLTKKGLIGRGGGQIILEDIRGLAGEFSEPMSLDLWGLAVDK